MTTTLPPSRWSDTLPELLGRVIDRLHRPDDRARLSAVCRSWLSGALQHLRHAPPPPFILHADGTFVTLPDRRFPSDTSFVGATGVWLLLYRTDDATTGRSRRSYLLYNPFLQTTVPLPALDAVIGEVDEEWFEVRKVLMRSTPDDVVVVSTNSSNYPIILCRPGERGAWYPKPRDVHYLRIIDIAFFGDRLCGVTMNEDLVLLNLGEDDHGMPIITSAKYVIKNNAQSAEEEEDTDDEEEYASSLEDEEDDSSDNGDISGSEEETDGEDDGASSLEEEDDNSDNGDMLGTEKETDGEYDDVSSLDDDEGDSSDNRDAPETDEEEDASSVEEQYSWQNDKMYIYATDRRSPYNVVQSRSCKQEDPDVPGDYIGTSRRLLESNGKLLMVRRQRYIPAKPTGAYNLKVEVMEANMDMPAWVPAAVHGINEQLFIGCRSSKSVPGNAKVGNSFICHFVDDQDVLDETQSIDQMVGRKSTLISPPV